MIQESRILHVVRRIALALTVVSAIAGCGFQLRGSVNLPFDTVYLEAAGAPSLIGEMAQNLSLGTNLRQMPSPTDAQALLVLSGEKADKRILTIGGTGRVREFLLNYQVDFRIVDNRTKDDLIPVQHIELQRDFSYDDSKVLAKEAEEQRLWKDMRNEAVQLVLRRMSVMRPVARQPD